jgi:hypothetical protein
MAVPIAGNSAGRYRRGQQLGRHRVHGDDRQPAIWWTLFVNPIADKIGWSRAAIQVAFTIFVLTETWLVPIEGYSSTFRPAPWCWSAAAVRPGWVMNSYADR